jgi:hypothetical protein
LSCSLLRFWPAAVELRHAWTGAFSGNLTTIGRLIAIAAIGRCSLAVPYSTMRLSTWRNMAEFTSNADLLRATMAAGNVTVLTSSTAKEMSREDEDWNDGALGGEADESHTGLVSMSDLTCYISTHVPALTDGKQHPGVKQRFEGAIFVAVQ